jgi:hypothetical protein
LDRTVLDKRIRLSTLRGLIQEDPSKRTFNFEELKQKLKLSSDFELEELLIDGVGDKLIDVKIDDASKKVRILRADQRSFDDKTSSTYKSILADWRENLQKISDVRSNQ